MAVNLLFFSFYDVLVWSILKPDDIGYITLNSFTLTMSQGNIITWNGTLHHQE